MGGSAESLPRTPRDPHPPGSEGPGPNPGERRPAAPGDPGGEPPGAVLQGVLERITFRSPETGFAVLAIAPEAGFGPPGELFAALGGRVAAVGRAPEPQVGDRLRLCGRWEVHPEHGRRFAFETLEALAPLGRDGLVRYLSSSRFAGVGPKLAERIVDALGPGTLARIRDEPTCLSGVRGLRPAVATELARRVREELGLQELSAFLYGVGLNTGQIEGTIRALGAGAERTVRADPYVLARRVDGIGFQSADGVARRLGFGEDSPERRRAALAHALHKSTLEGHTLQRASELFHATRRLLRQEVEDAALVEELRALEQAGELVVDASVTPTPGDPAVYLPALHACESRLAENLRALAAAGPAPALADAAALANAERRFGLRLHPDQANAVLGLLSSSLGLLTGGPGVGKTTIVRLLVTLAEEAGREVVLASPTGRAAKRLSEACGREAKTIHRLLAYEPHTGGFQHDARNPLRADLVVVDEVSMLDVVLAHHLAKAIAPPTRLILIGDPDQLPSVTAGNVLADLLACGRFPVHRLGQVFRQKGQSLIVHNAHRILAGELPELSRDSGEDGGDFFLFPAEGEEQTARRLVEVTTERIPARFGLDWTRDVQVLSPMYRGPAGVDGLNASLREALALGGRELRRGERIWREGDRVIQTRNDYERHLFNGDMGRIVRIAADGKSLVVRFPERELELPATSLGDLQPAFAITVHRSQGAEFPAVVMPLVTQHAMMLRRHLLYTAVTRAQRLVVLVGSRRALELAVRNAEEGGRESALAERLRRA